MAWFYPGESIEPTLVQLISRGKTEILKVAFYSLVFTIILKSHLKVFVALRIGPDGFGNEVVIAFSDAEECEEHF